MMISSSTIRQTVTHKALTGCSTRTFRRDGGYTEEVVHLPCEKEFTAYQQALRALEEFEELNFPVLTAIPPIDDEAAIPALEIHVRQRFEELEAAAKEAKAAYDKCRGITDTH
jgi:hypothetical protein